jgi:ribA/ribD-fused uncharacterized protein
MDTIKGFFGSYRFLSNFWPCLVKFEGLVYHSSEAAFQASKLENVSDRVVFVSLNPWEAKRHGRTVTIRRDWEDVKLDVMWHILLAKFSRDPLRTQLLDTGDTFLEETNHWGDTFWGVCVGRGENNLGELLMAVRSELRFTEGLDKSPEGRRQNA